MDDRGAVDLSVAVAEAMTVLQAWCVTNAQTAAAEAALSELLGLRDKEAAALFRALKRKRRMTARLVETAHRITDQH